MISEGQIVLFAFPQVDQAPGKLRPALLLRSAPTKHGDWLICMISTQLHQQIPKLDEVVVDTDKDFSDTGLKVTSLIRITRLAVVSQDVLQGSIGTISVPRLNSIRVRLANWIVGVPS